MSLRARHAVLAVGLIVGLLTSLAEGSDAAAGACHKSCSKRHEKSAFTDSELSLLQLDARFIRTAAVSRNSSYSQATALDARMGNKMTEGAGSREKPKQLWHLREGARLNEVLVVPSLKLIFCFIPKNACTQFNRLMNALNGIDQEWDGEICGKRDPNYRSTMYGNLTAKDLDAALNDHAWTKATFLRDPFERLTSAYLSKCVHPRECGGCMGLESSGSVDPGMTDLANVLQYTGDAHFLPQSSLCGGLGDNIGAYDFVGHITRDSAAVAKQVTDMLELALARKSKGSVQSLQVEHKGDAQGSSGRAEGVVNPFGKRVGQQESRVLELGRRFFPASGPTAGDPHVHAHQNASDYFHDYFSLNAALRQYADDYDRLPGLRRPAWAYRVSALYDAFEGVYQRPEWLTRAPPATG